MMSKFNFLLFLNAYDDARSSNTPSRNNFKWQRDLNSAEASKPDSLQFDLAPGETKELFNGVRSLSQDNTTQYSLSLVPSTTTTYQLTWSGGTAPAFRASRTSGADASTQVTVTINGPIVTFASTGGTPFSLISGGVVVGDFVRIGSAFNPGNQGEWKVVAVTATSFSVNNSLGAAEGPITLGASFADQVKIYSAAGVQVGDTLVISGGFSPVSQDSYKIVSVSDSFVQFSSINSLPQEGPITTEAINIYSSAKRLVYLETDQKVSLMINGQSGTEVSPLVLGVCSSKPGMFLRTSTIYSMSVTNDSTEIASVFYASIE